MIRKADRQAFRFTYRLCSFSKEGFNVFANKEVGGFSALL